MARYRRTQHSLQRNGSLSRVPRRGCCSCNGRATLVEACAQHVTDAHDPRNCTAEVLQMHEQATHVKTASKKLHSLSSMSNGATAAFRHMLQIGLHGACIASRGSHGLQRAFRGSLKLLSRGRVLGTYICSGVINSGHENTVPYSGCSASLSNRLRLGGNCATNFGQGSRGDTQSRLSVGEGDSRRVVKSRACTAENAGEAQCDGR